VVILGLTAVIIGGPVFALLFICVGTAGYGEYLQLVARINPNLRKSFARVGFGTIVGLGLAALVDATTESLFALAALSVTAPLTLLLFHPTSSGAFSAWTLASAGSLYLGLPVFAAVAVRSIPGSTDAIWLSDLATNVSVGWNSTPRGLAWALLVILATWVGDTAAYFVGRTWGKRKFAPGISPNKTIEGAAGGLVGSICVCALTFQVSGLGIWWLGSIIGGVLGVAGQIGDLAESFLKRQAGVKDSGAMIPGHGGILDRIDALLFAFPVGFVIAAGFERIAS
jgi:phosphatidate cytidylyltransferase